MKEIDILQFGSDRAEASAGRGWCKHSNLMLPADQVRAKNVELQFKLL